MTDRVKETLFERLHDDVDGKRIADVFAGTGTIGLEAISRGAAGAVFFEYDRRAFHLLEQNVATLGVEESVLCWRADVLRTSYRPKGVPHLLPFDTVFFDPPYRMISEIEPGSALYKSLERLARDTVTAPEALLVVRTPHGATLNAPPCWQYDREFEFSTMAVHLLQKRLGKNDDGE